MSVCVSALHVFTKKQGKMNCTEQQHVQHVAESHDDLVMRSAGGNTYKYIYTDEGGAAQWGVSAEVCSVWRPSRVRVRILRSGSLTGCGLRGEEGRSAGRLRACDGCSRSKGREVRRGHVRKNHENSSGEFFVFLLFMVTSFLWRYVAFFPAGHSSKNSDFKWIVINKKKKTQLYH